MSGDVADAQKASEGAEKSAIWAPVGIGVVTAGALTAIWFGDPTTPGGWLPVCPTKALFGVTCPGCGSTRAIYSLMHGDVLGALHYNALGVVAVVLLAYAFVVYCVRVWSGKRLPTWQRWRYAPMVIGILVVVWFVIRNIPVQPFWSLHV